VFITAVTTPAAVSANIAWYAFVPIRVGDDAGGSTSAALAQPLRVQHAEAARQDRRALMRQRPQRVPVDCERHRHPAERRRRRPAGERARDRVRLARVRGPQVDRPVLRAAGEDREPDRVRAQAEERRGSDLDERRVHPGAPAGARDAERDHGTDVAAALLERSQHEAGVVEHDRLPEELAVAAGVRRDVLRRRERGRRTGARVDAGDAWQAAAVCVHVQDQVALRPGREPPRVLPPDDGLHVVLEARRRHDARAVGREREHVQAHRVAQAPCTSRKVAVGQRRHQRVRGRVVFELPHVPQHPGLDVDASIAARRAIDVRPDGPAARAGVVEGREVRGFSVWRGDVEREVELVTWDGEREERVAYLPRGEETTVPVVQVVGR
jgi:hypothetical protein